MATNVDKVKLEKIAKLIRDLKDECLSACVPMTVCTNKHERQRGRVVIEVPPYIFDKVK